MNTDDELPDYIMVMVANRKTEEQMAEDLSLFLSSNTNKFTTWFVVQVVHVESLHWSCSLCCCCTLCKMKQQQQPEFSDHS